MSGKKQVVPVIEQFFEVRYRANSKVLDRRGDWAESIAKEFGFPHWKIDANRIDILSKESKESVFVGHQNCGFVFFLPPDTDSFGDKAARIIRQLFSFDGFGHPLATTRIGVRSKYITQFSGTFEQLRKQFLSRYINLTPKAQEMYSATLVDVGAPLNFTDKIGSFNTMSGPMQRKEMPRFFNRECDFPEVGLFFDIDYWSRANQDFEAESLAEVVQNFSAAAWDRHEKFQELILGS